MSDVVGSVTKFGVLCPDLEHQQKHQEKHSELLANFLQKHQRGNKRKREEIKMGERSAQKTEK